MSVKHVFISVRFQSIADYSPGKQQFARKMLWQSFERIVKSCHVLYVSLSMRIAIMAKSTASVREELNDRFRTFAGITSRTSRQFVSAILSTMLGGESIFDCIPSVLYGGMRRKLHIGGLFLNYESPPILKIQPETLFDTYWYHIFEIYYILYNNKISNINISILSGVSRQRQVKCGFTVYNLFLMFARQIKFFMCIKCIVLVAPHT